MTGIEFMTGCVLCVPQAVQRQLCQLHALLMQRQWLSVGAIMVWQASEMPVMHLSHS